MNVIVHHWDADGICSAAILVNVLEKRGEDFKNVSLFPGIFKFDERIWKRIEAAKTVYVVDVNMVDEVEKIGKPVVFLDHHIQRRIEKKSVTHVNPLIEGRYVPSASYVVSEFFNQWSWLSAIGAVGDLGKSAFEFDWLRRVLDEYNLSESEALRLAELVNSPSLVCDLEGVERAVYKVADSDPKELLRDDEWNDNLKAVEKEVAKIVERAENFEKFAIARFSSKYNVTSIVARRLVWDMKFELAVVINEDYHGYSQVYVRVGKGSEVKYGIGDLIRKLRALKFNAGGKEEVLGILCERDRLEEALRVVGGHLGVCI